MRDFLKTATLMWLGCCVRNKEDRDNTVKFINHLGMQIENSVRSFSQPKVDTSEKTSEDFR